MLSRCVFRPALGCSSYTDISYHNNMLGFRFKFNNTGLQPVSKPVEQEVVFLRILIGVSFKNVPSTVV